MNVGLKKRREQRIRELFENPGRVRAAMDASNERSAQAWNAWRQPPTRNQWAYKFAICAILYAVIWGAYRLEHPAARQVQAIVEEALTKPMNFTAAAEWYEQYFGDLPALLPAFNRGRLGASEGEFIVPAEGAVLGAYSAAAQGLWVATKPRQDISVIATGLVHAVTENPATGLTVVVRHADGLESIYGALDQAYVKKNDWLVGGAKVGAVNTVGEGREGRLYFALKRQGIFIDPREVIPFD